MKILYVLVFRRAGDPACRLGEGYGSFHIKCKAKEMVVKSGPYERHFHQLSFVFLRVTGVDDQRDKGGGSPFLCP